ncbi:MAG: phage major capsid protein [Alphaproteobacteria bacterium]|nr:phage major capsid protein [Alphaproteobacteria bacterium]
MEIKSLNEKGEIEGYASVFGELDRNGDIVERGAFKKAIKEFSAGKKPKLLWQHDTTEPIGIIDELFEDNHGLFVKAHLLMELPKAKEAYLLLKNKALDNFSIGYRIRNHFIKNNQKHLTDIELLEISIVTFPACESATIDEVKFDQNINQNTVRNLNKKGETKMKLPLNTNTITNEIFSNFIRSGADDFLKKSLNENSDKDGAVFLPSNILRKIDDKLRYLSPMRNISKITTISSSSIDILVDEKLPGANWCAENNERKETTSPELKKIKINVHELCAKPKASQALLDDAQIDVESWLIEKISENFATLEDDAFINGDGKNKPHGFLKCKTSLENETGSLQYFLSGAKGKFVNSETALNTLIEIVCSLKPHHVKNANWIMSRSALAEIRKIKNSDGTSIWQMSMSEATPATLLGYPVVIDDNMPALNTESGTFSVAFGDFFSGYQIVDRQGLSVLRDPYTSKPFVEFFASKRVGGDVVDFDAIKLLKFDIAE